MRCHVCDQSFLACWQFRNDDQYCGLCGEKVLHLQVGQAVPSPNREVWLHLQRGQPLILTMVWRRGLSEDQPRRSFRPLLDLSRSRATFSDPRVGHLAFGFEELVNPNVRPEVVMLSLTPQFDGIDQLALPARGVRGRLHLALAVGVEERDALLLPHPEPLLECQGIDPSIVQAGDVWRIYQKGEAVIVPMQLSARVPVWIPRLVTEAANCPDITVAGFEAPVQLEPNQPYPFELRVNSSSWAPGTAKPFAFAWHVTGAPRVPWAGKVMLTAGDEVVFVPNPLLLDVQLGQMHPTAVAVSLKPGPGGGKEEVQIVDCSVRRKPEEGNWLRLLYPTRHDLPRLVLSAGAKPGPNQQVLEQLLLDVDTTRLDRQRFAGKDLEGWLDLQDQRGRRWTCNLRVSPHRPALLGSYLALDFGTTNSCAAHSGGPNQALLPVPFDKQQVDKPELFPSDIYFEDLTDPDHPVFWIGFEAQVRAKVNPQCCLRSVKRKFQFRDEVFVMDEQGRTYTYPVTQVMLFILKRLIALAEARLGREITNLGLTFPTKWTPKVRQKLAQVLDDLAKWLGEERKPFPIHVLPPEIDEANAVAINLVTTKQDQPWPQEFYLIAYDFGGGTVDTSVIQFTFGREPRTRYVGIGGRSDFGGDDVTRAVMLLLHERLTHALRDRDLPLTKQAQGDKARLLEIPLVPDGEPIRDQRPGAAAHNRDGRANWNVLWWVAEAIKIKLCEGTPAGNPIADEVRLQQGKLVCYLAPAGGRASSELITRSLHQVLSFLGKTELDQFYQELTCTLDQVCDYPLPDIDRINGGRAFQVRDRIGDTIHELQWQCRDAGIQPYKIVLAGGGCRLPLIAQLFRHYFPSPDGRDLIHYDRDFAKRRVAHGMAAYLQLRTHHSVGGIARSVEVAHHDLGLQQLRFDGYLRPEFVPIVKVGTRIEDVKTWHRFAFGPSQVQANGDGSSRLVVFTQDWSRGPQQYGYFDLSHPGASAEGDEPCQAQPLPSLPNDEYQAELRLRGAGQMEVCVVVQGQRYGPYPFRPLVHDPEAVLQS
jgi:hypothetical protein